jgi:hypothetical protein
VDVRGREQAAERWTFVVVNRRPTVVVADAV